MQNLGTCLAHSQVQTWEHFVRGEGVWQNVPNPKLKMRFIMTPTRLDNPPNLCENNNIMKLGQIWWDLELKKNSQS